MERYEIIKDIGSGNFGVAKLIREKWSGELYAVKFIERGFKIDEHVQREIINHRSLKHPNIVRFKKVLRGFNSVIIMHPISYKNLPGVIFFELMLAFFFFVIELVLSFATSYQLYKSINVMSAVYTASFAASS